MAQARLPAGLVLAVVSAVSFGASGALARGLLTTGWSAGSIVTVRVGLGAVVVAPLGIQAMRGRWSLLRGNRLLILGYGGLAVAGAQFCYFSAIQHMPVGPALMIEYAAPAVVVGWLWLREGQRPGAVTLGGAGLAAVGLVLVLGLLSGVQLSTPGVLWALGATLGATTYFLLSADESNGLPPLGLAAAGLVVGTGVLVVLGAIGVLPLHAATRAATYAGHQVAWWAPLAVLGLVTAGIAYVTGIMASRQLGSRLASFVALLEVLSAVLFAGCCCGSCPPVSSSWAGCSCWAGS